MEVKDVVGNLLIWGLIKIWAPFGPLDYKENTIIQTPKGPIILINPHVKKGIFQRSLELRELGPKVREKRS